MHEFRQQTNKVMMIPNREEERKTVKSFFFFLEDVDEKFSLLYVRRTESPYLGPPKSTGQNQPTGTEKVVLSYPCFRPCSTVKHLPTTLYAKDYQSGQSLYFDWCCYCLSVTPLGSRCSYCPKSEVLLAA